MNLTLLWLEINVNTQTTQWHGVLPRNITGTLTPRDLYHQLCLFLLLLMTLRDLSAAERKLSPECSLTSDFREASPSLWLQVRLFLVSKTF